MQAFDKVLMPTPERAPRVEAPAPQPLPGFTRTRAAATQPGLATWLAIVTLALVAIGLFYRGYALERKVYGFDETATLLRVSGTTLPEFDRAARDGTLRDTRAVRDRFQRLHAEANAGATIHSLAVDDPQHPPLYYVLERWWEKFGDSLAFDRALAVLFGIALLPAAYLLARELFDEVTARIAIALVAVSPFHVLFAQYNREYSLWALLAALSSAALLAALRCGGALRYAAYASCATLGMYTDPLFFFVLGAHAIYALSLGPARARPVLFSVLAAIVAFVPWIVVLVRQPHLVSTSTAWNAVALPARILVEKWLFELSAVFFDAEYARAALMPVAAIAASLAAAAVAATAVFEPRRRSVLFAVLLAAAPTMPFVVSDLLFHTSRSTASRYLTPGWLGIELLVAAGLAAALRRPHARVRFAALAAFVAFGALGTYSLGQSAAARFWWIDSNDAPLVAISATLDTLSQPAICYADDAISLLILSDSLKRDVRLTKQPAAGCLAVATAAHMSSAPGGASAYERVALPSTGAERSFASVHAETAQAHRFTYEPLALWRRKSGV